MGKYKPFRFLFRKLSPAEFARVFEKEARQTRAFLLSFALNSEYVKAVIDIYKDAKFTGLVTGYLSRVEKEAVNTAFIRNVEKHVKGIIGKSGRIAIETRKNMALKARNCTV